MNTLLYEVKDHVARITLNRPDAANALNLEMGRDLMHASIRAGEDPAVRAVILTGAGKMFSGGGDLTSFAAQEDRLLAHLKEVALYLHAAISRFVRMDAPVIAAVNGSAGGAGMSLCLFADLVIAAESAKFTLAYTRAGLSPDGGSTYFLPRIIGVRRALELALTNRALSAREAMDWGIVTKVVGLGQQGLFVGPNFSRHGATLVEHLQCEYLPALELACLPALAPLLPASYRETCARLERDPQGRIVMPPPDIAPSCS